MNSYEYDTQQWFYFLGTAEDQKKESQKESKPSDVMSLLSSDDFDGLCFDQESGDTMALLNEILNAGKPSAQPSIYTHFAFYNAGPYIPRLKLSNFLYIALLPTLETGGSGDSLVPPLSPFGSSAQSSNSFMPSYLLDLGSLTTGPSSGKSS